MDMSTDMRIDMRIGMCIGIAMAGLCTDRCIAFIDALYEHAEKRRRMSMREKEGA